MLKTLHIHPRVEKNLEQMKALDNAPKFAAERAEAIIDALKTGTIMARAGRLSKTKDARIRRLFKYDLGKMGNFQGDSSSGWPLPGHWPWNRN